MISANVQVQAQFYHLDPMEVVWHGNYVRFFEQARCALLDKIDYNYPQMRESGYIWPIVDMRVKFVRPVTFGQLINVDASIVEHENRLKINYLITDVESGEKLTKGFTIQVAVDGKTEEMLFESPAVLLKKIKEAQCLS